MEGQDTLDRDILEQSGWLNHIKGILDAANSISSYIDEGKCVLVHCSDGWDRTSQCVALAQILLDPFYRTINGFQILVEKDWLAMGHKFDDRCGHIGALNEDAAKEISPVFTQFLDCVWQLYRQKRRAFQFNERYLIEMNENAFSCQYGTFLGNCDKDRKDLKLSKSTQSLWDHMDSRHEEYLNPLYEPQAFGILTGLDLRAPAIALWNGLYNRFDGGILPKESMADTSIVSLEHIGVLEVRLATLQSRLAELRSTTTIATKSSTSGDSGHGSQNGAGSVNSTPAMATGDGMVNDFWNRQDTLHESGALFDSSYASSDECCVSAAVAWQPLRGAMECSSANCGAEFVSPLERRLHCFRCGRIFCRRCVKNSMDGQERLCDLCSASSSSIVSS